MTTQTYAGTEISVDAEGFLTDPAQWTPDVAEDIARTEGIDPISPRHWEVIEFVRHGFEDRGSAPNVRALAKASGVPIKELYQLFPKGPAKIAAKIAGAPKPRGCI